MVSSEDKTRANDEVEYEYRVLNEEDKIVGAILALAVEVSLLRRFFEKRSGVK